MKHRDYVRKEFNKVAGKYDSLTQVHRYQRPIQSEVIQNLELTENMYVLDLGCGTGEGTLEIAQRVDRGKVIGVDLSDKMIAVANGKKKPNNVTFECRDVYSFTKSDYFDHIVTTNAYHHFEDKKQMISHMYGLLKPGGVLTIQDYCTDYFLMKGVDIGLKILEKAHVGSSTSAQLTSMLKEAGFEANVMTKKVDWFLGIMIATGKR